MENMFPERVVLARKEQGVKIKEAIRLLGISRSTLWQYEKGNRLPPVEVACNMARIYGVSIDWLLGITELKQPPPDTTKRVGISIPVPLFRSIPAGISPQLHGDILCYVETPLDQVSYDKYFYIHMQDDSLMGSRIHQGDLLLIRKQPEVESWEIAMVRTEHQKGSIKRVIVSGDDYVLFPGNATHEPQVVKRTDAQIIGKVVKVEFAPTVHSQ